MADGNPPRRPTNRPGSSSPNKDDEATGNAVPARPVRARPVQAKPVPGAAVPSKPSQAGIPTARPGVIKSSPVTPTASTATTKVVGKSTTVTPKVPAKPKVVAAAAVDDEDDRPRKNARDDYDDDDRPRKKRKKKGKKNRGGDDEGKDHSAVISYVLIGVGVLMSVVGAAGYGGAAHAVASVFFVLIGQIICIPVIIVALMVIGSVLGIEYGTLGGAVRNLAALSFLVNGLSMIADWAGIPFFFYAPLISILSFALFMTLFDLDAWEAMITTFILNLLTRAFWFVMFIVLLLIVMKKSKDADFDDEGPDFDPKPGFVEPGGSGDGGDEPGPRRRGNRQRVGEKEAPVPVGADDE